MPNNTQMWVIRRAEDRYPNMDKRGYPAEFAVVGIDLARAEDLAALLSNYYAGCDYLYYVVTD